MRYIVSIGVAPTLVSAPKASTGVASFRSGVRDPFGR
jgi:hypothetical protein